MTRQSATLSRFAAARVEPDRSHGLRADHPALAEGRTIFPSSVVETWDSPRFLVSGHNNPKLGRAVVKGPRAGWPIYHVTLEERATCPRSCPVWADCYGNTMPYARRHTPDEDFVGLLKAEVLTVARTHPDGMVVRLHALGDFFSLEYVRAWADLIKSLPQLHVFGFTARSEDTDDTESREIARAIRELTEGNWEQFAIRFSRAHYGPQTSVVVERDPELPGVIVCPAQLEKTAACATCGLCWADAARDKAIAFLRHGMKGGRTAAPGSAPKTIFRRAPVVPPTPSKPSVTAADRIAAIDEGEKARIAAAYGATFKRAAA